MQVDSQLVIDDAPHVVGVFDFTIGDPNLVGGIDRIRTQSCSSATRCSVQWNDIRD